MAREWIARGCFWMGGAWARPLLLQQNLFGFEPRTIQQPDTLIFRGLACVQDVSGNFDQRDSRFFEMRFVISHDAISMDVNLIVSEFLKFQLGTENTHWYRHTSEWMDGMLLNGRGTGSSVHWCGVAVLIYSKISSDSNRLLLNSSLISFFPVELFAFKTSRAVWTRDVFFSRRNVSRPGWHIETENSISIVSRFLKFWHFCSSRIESWMWEHTC